MQRPSLRAAAPVVLATMACALGHAGAPGEPVGGDAGPASMADKQCTSPSNLTGPVTMAAAAGYPLERTSTVWDGTAYAVVWDGGGDLGFGRYAADGTPLIPPVGVITTDSDAPSLVFDGTDLGVAWDSGTAIRFCRLSLSGAKLTSDVIVDSGSGTQDGPQLVWTGTQFGVSWTDTRDGNQDVFFNRLSPAGVVQQPGADTRVTDSPQAASQSSAAMDWDGARFGVVWTDTRHGNQQIYGNLVSSAGARAGADIRITSNAADSRDPSLVWNGAQYGLAFVDERTTGSDIYVAILSAGNLGPFSETQLTANTGLASSPFIAWSGAEFGITWIDSDTWNVAFSRATTSGASTGSDIQLTSEVYYVSGRASLAFGTKGYGFSYTHHDVGGSGSSRTIFAGIGCRGDATPPTCPAGLTVTGNSAAGVTLGWAVPGSDPETELAYHRVYRDGVAIGVTTAPTYTDAPRPAGSPLYSVVAVNAAGRESIGCDVVSAPLPTGSCGQDLTGSQLVSLSSATAEDASVAWTGSSYGVAWEDDRDVPGFREIYFRRVSAGGATLGPDVRVTTDPASSLQASLVWTGAEHGVAWSEGRDLNFEVYFARLTAEGVKMGADVRISGDAQTSATPSLVWTGSEYGVAWRDAQYGNDEILFARISGTGVEIGGDVRVTTDASSSFDPSLVFTGNEFGIAWCDSRDGNFEIYFTRLSAAGSEIGSDVRVTSDPAGSFSPHLAWSGTSFGVTWEDQRDGNQEVYFARISAAGAKLAGDVRITSGTSSSYPRGLAWTGSEYGLVWSDDRLGNPNYDVYYTLVGDNGVPSGLETRLTFSPTMDLAHGVAVGGRGLGVVYQQNGMADQVRFVGLGCGAPDTTPPSCPSAPQELTRTPGNPGTLTLGWGPSIDAESDLSHYRIFKDGSEVANTLALVWTDTSFDPVSGPTYWVDAVNAAWLVSPGCASVDTSDAVPPSCPTNVIATNVTQTSATISWVPATDARSGMRRYRVYRNNVLETSIDHPATTVNVAGLSAGTTYNFAVVAEDWAGNSSTACGTATVWISTSPITLFVTKDGNGIDALLDWNDAGLNEYVVYRSVSPQWASEHARVPVSEDEDPVLQDGVQIWYYYIQQRGL